MADFKEVLRLLVDADTKGAVREVETLGKASERELSKSEKALDQWGHRLTKAGTAMIGVGAVALVGLGKMAQASEEANLSQVKLDNTLANMPKLAGENSKQFVDLANSIQDVTAADADAIVEAQALLGTFQLTADEIKGITPLVVDYARKFGVDIPDAAVQVGKALDGQIGALKRNGVSIDETLFKTDRYRAVQEALSDQVGGFAEAEGKTFAGSLERMKNQLGDLAEGVGGGAVDAFTTMFGAVDKVAGALEGISPGAQNTLGKLATFGAVGLVAAGGLNLVVGQAILARDNIGTLRAGLSGAIDKLGGLKTAAGLAAGVAGLGALGVAIDQYNKAQQRSNIDKFTAEFLAAGESADAMQAALRNAADNGVAELVGGFQQLAETSPAAAERFLEQAEAAGASESVLSQFREALETTSAAQRQVAEDTDATAGSFDDATDSVKSYSDELKGLFDPIFAAVNAQRALDEANAAVTGAEMELAAAIAEHGADSIEAVAATDKLREAQNRAAEAAVGQQGALDQLRTSVQDGTTSVEDAKTKLQEMADQGLISAGTAAAVAAEFDAIADAQGRIDRNVEISVVTRQSTILAGSRNVPRQHGGPTHMGQIYRVAEAGPELLEEGGKTFLIPGGDGQVVPFSRAGGMGGGGGTVRLVIDSGSNPADRMLLDLLRRVIRMDHGGDVQAALGFSR